MLSMLSLQNADADGLLCAQACQLFSDIVVAVSRNNHVASHTSKMFQRDEVLRRIKEEGITFMDDLLRLSARVGKGASDEDVRRLPFYSKLRDYQGMESSGS